MPRWLTCLASESQWRTERFVKAGLIGTQILPPSASFQKAGLPNCRHLPSLFYKYIIKSVADTFRTCFRFKEKIYAVVSIFERFILARNGPFLRTQGQKRQPETNAAGAGMYEFSQRYNHMNWNIFLALHHQILIYALYKASNANFGLTYLYMKL